MSHNIVVKTLSFADSDLLLLFKTSQKISALLAAVQTWPDGSTETKKARVFTLKKIYTSMLSFKAIDLLDESAKPPHFQVVKITGQSLRQNEVIII